MLEKFNNDNLIKDAIELQLQCWAGRNFDKSRLESVARQNNQGSVSAFAFVLEGNSAHLIEKPGWPNLQSSDGQFHPFKARVSAYETLLSEALMLYPISGRVVIPVELGDEAAEVCEVPTFSFQKRRGESNILLPDFEFVLDNFERPKERYTTPFSEKANKAVFNGSTTGLGTITIEDAIYARSPRLHAFRYFKAFREVDFRLCNIVQCQNSDVEKYLRNDGVGGAFTTWSKVFSNKFAISIDGNGATCSRPAIILDSTSVLLKYHSPFVLYWSELLIPWLHYIPIYTNEDVIHVVQRETANPGIYEKISERGRSFAEIFLSKEATLAYTATLMEQFHDSVCS